MVIYQHGGDIYSQDYRYDFSANINPMGTPVSVIRAAQESILTCANYPDSNCRTLVKKIAEKEQVKEEQIICGNGAAELIFLIVHAVNPQKALLIAPGFAEYEQALNTVDCDIRFYDLSEEDGFIYKDDYIDHLTDDLDMIFLCNPNNPTGILMKPEWIRKVLEICKEKDIFVVLDSCFIDFLEEEEAYNFVSAIEEYPNLFILKAFTKIYAMAGLRLGYAITSDLLLLDRCKGMIQPWSVSIPAQAAGIAAISEQQYVKETKQLIQQERIWLKNQLGKYVDRVYDGQANFLFFRSHPQLGERCREEGILIRDCSNYHGLKKGYYRIAVRTREENLELIRVLKKILT